MTFIALALIFVALAALGYIVYRGDIDRRNDVNDLHEEMGRIFARLRGEMQAIELQLDGGKLGEENDTLAHRVEQMYGMLQVREYTDPSNPKFKYSRAANLIDHMIAERDALNDRYQRDVKSLRGTLDSLDIRVGTLMDARYDQIIKDSKDSVGKADQVKADTLRDVAALRNIGRMVEGLVNPNAPQSVNCSICDDKGWVFICEEEGSMDKCSACGAASELNF